MVCGTVAVSYKDATKHFATAENLAPHRGAASHQHKAVLRPSNALRPQRPIETGALRELAQLSLEDCCAGVNTGSRHHNLQ